MSADSLAGSTARSKFLNYLLFDRRRIEAQVIEILEARTRSIERTSKGGMLCGHALNKNLKIATSLRRTLFGWPRKAMPQRSSSSIADTAGVSTPYAFGW